MKISVQHSSTLTLPEYSMSLVTNSTAVPRLPIHRATSGEQNGETKVATRTLESSKVLTLALFALARRAQSLNHRIESQMSKMLW